MEQVVFEISKNIITNFSTEFSDSLREMIKELKIGNSFFKDRGRFVLINDKTSRTSSVDVARTTEISEQGIRTLLEDEFKRKKIRITDNDWEELKEQSEKLRRLISLKTIYFGLVILKKRQE